MDLYRRLRPLLFNLDPETAHSLTATLIRIAVSGPIKSMAADRYTVDDDRLASERFGVQFENPVGLAAGFDKNAKLVTEMESFGFGHIEIGGVTSQPQQGNQRPRLFRLEEDEAIINRMGFNNDGAEVIARRLERTSGPEVPVGINIGKLDDAPVEEAPEEYARTYELLAELGDYFVVNVSCPNISARQSLQAGENLARILAALEAKGAGPLLVKISPDMTSEDIEETLSVAERAGVDGIIATNTSSNSADRAYSLSGEHRAEDGGVSGAPIRAQSTQTVRFIAQRTDLPIIGVGGVSSAEDAYDKIRAGASLVQLYTGLIYEGPSIARDINLGLLKLLRRDGYPSISDAIGADLPTAEGEETKSRVLADD